MTQVWNVERSYWNGTGAEQARYDEMLAANFEFTKTSHQVFNRYYRFFNDGDFAGPALRSNARWMSPRELEQTSEYQLAARKLENDATTRIIAEYKRFERTRRA